DGNVKSKRVQEKCGFVYNKTRENLEVPLLDEVRTSHTNVLTRESWLELNK
ncbi:MAG: RimJ/RimL family protein N-acetyltransferase, partial [[Eubacterium] sulci]|nr:RimJ/RimL family protein N-acetyltransferase [[Eubacterium] sulci]